MNAACGGAPDGIIPTASSRPHETETPRAIGTGEDVFKRLSTQIYLTIVATLLIVVVVAGGAWRHSGEGRQMDRAAAIAGELLADGLPPAGAPHAAQRDAAVDLAQRLRLDLALYSASGERIAQFGRPLPDPEKRHGKPGEGGFIFGRGGPAFAVPLPDGRLIVARLPNRGPVPRPVRFIFFLAAVALIVGLCAWPVVRGLTRRLERLQAGVERFGAGDLSARVEVKGRDEIAKLAESFNQSAARIASLVAAQKLLLANASHELRTPLARIRMGLELMETKPSPERRAAVRADIAELDEIVEEILLLSRLDRIEHRDERGPVDLLALAAEEASRYVAIDVSGEAIELSGDARLLRRLVRNLLDNATKHGAPPIALSLTRDGARGEAVLRVADHGPGVPRDLAEQVFEPFHRGPARGRIEGNGLGLALVRSIARRHGGQASFLAGEDGRFNVVEIRLPMAD